MDNPRKRQETSICDVQEVRSGRMHAVFNGFCPDSPYLPFSTGFYPTRGTDATLFASGMPRISWATVICVP